MHTPQMGRSSLLHLFLGCLSETSCFKPALPWCCCMASGQTAVWERAIGSRACLLSLRSPGSCLSCVTDMPVAGHVPAGPDPGPAELISDPPLRCRLIWCWPHQWLLLVIVTEPDSDPDLLASLSGLTSHLACLCLWSLGSSGSPYS